MNILLTSVGRRAYMVRYFQEALKGDGEVHVCNSDDLTVAFQYAEHTVISPLIYDENYIPFLVKYCKENRIDAVISLFDIDLLMLAKHKDEFEANGTRVIVANPDYIEVCNDKWKTYEFLVQNGICAPKTYLDYRELTEDLKRGAMNFPVIVKPRFGCGSIGLSVAHDMEDLVYLKKKVENEVNSSYLKYESSITDNKVLFQEFLHGQEYGVDIINDLQGNFVHANIKKKLAMRSGETDIAETVEDEQIFCIAEKIAGLSRHIGNVDMDVFVVGEKRYVLEMNARFGGGYPFSHVAGCNLPKAIVLWLKGETAGSDVVTAKPGIRTYKEITMTVEK